MEGCDDDIFLDCVSKPPAPPSPSTHSKFMAMIDLTGEDSETENSDTNDLSEDDLEPVMINAQGSADFDTRQAMPSSNYSSQCAEKYAASITSPSTSQSTSVSNGRFRYSIPSALALSDSDSDSYARATTSKDDSLNVTLSDQDRNADIGWPPKKSRSQVSSTSDSENDFDMQSSQNSLKCFHPLSDSDHSDHETAPPKKKQASRKQISKPATIQQRNATSSSAASPSKNRKKRRTPEDKAREEEEKQAKKREKDALRRLRPENCLKYLVVEVDTTLLEVPAFRALLECPRLNELEHRVASRDIPFSIGWYRKLAPNEQGIEIEQPCEQLLLQILEMDSLKDLMNGGDSLCEHVTSVLESVTFIKKLAIIIFGSAKYFKERSGKKKKNAHDITKQQLQEAIVNCNVEVGTTFRIVETAQEVSEWIYRYSKSVAEQPFKCSKRGWQNNFRFDIDSMRAKSVLVGPNGEGLPQLWAQVLGTFKRVPLEACQAIIAAYPSPSSLIAAYEKCSSEKEAMNLLQNLLVLRDMGPLAVERRVGPSISKKIYTVLTSTQPATLLTDCK